jgi:hypothetical protein
MLRFAPYIAAGVLALALWGVWQYAARMKDQRDAALATAHAYQQVVAAEKARHKALEKLRERYEESERKLRGIPNDGCLDRRIPDALGLLLKPDGKAGDPGAGAEEGAADGR